MGAQAFANNAAAKIVRIVRHDFLIIDGVFRARDIGCASSSEPGSTLGDTYMIYDPATRIAALRCGAMRAQEMDKA
jgi:hypothetical protein